MKDVRADRRDEDPGSLRQLAQGRCVGRVDLDEGVVRPDSRPDRFEFGDVAAGEGDPGRRRRLGCEVRGDQLTGEPGRS